jgi:hypothetical protein
MHFIKTDTQMAHRDGGGEVHIVSHQEMKIKTKRDSSTYLLEILGGRGKAGNPKCWEKVEHLECSTSLGKPHWETGDFH